MGRRLLCCLVALAFLLAPVSGLCLEAPDSEPGCETTGCHPPAAGDSAPDCCCAASPQLPAGGEILAPPPSRVPTPAAADSATPPAIAPQILTPSPVVDEQPRGPSPPLFLLHASLLI